MVEAAEQHRTQAIPSLIMSNSFAMQRHSFLLNLQRLSLLLSCAPRASHFIDWKCAIYARLCVRIHPHARRGWLRQLEMHCLRPTVLSDGGGLNLLGFRAGFLTLYGNLHASSRFLQTPLTPSKGKADLRSMGTNWMKAVTRGSLLEALGAVITKYLLRASV